MARNFIVINWENTSQETALKMINELEENVKGFDTVGANMGDMLCMCNHDDIDTFKSSITEIVHKHNDGMWCDVKVVSEESIEHLL